MAPRSPSTTPILFSETQRFSKWWLLLAIEPLIIIIPIFLSKDVPWQTMAWVIPLTALAPALMQTAVLQTEYHTEGLYIKYIPFRWRWKFISSEEITTAYIRTYDPIGEYGGWGIKRMDKKTGWCYNTRGKTGLQLILTDGSKILIGTQHPDDLTPIAEFWSSKG